MEKCRKGRGRESKDPTAWLKMLTGRRSKLEPSQSARKSGNGGKWSQHQPLHKATRCKRPAERRLAGAFHVVSSVLVARPWSWKSSTFLLSSWLCALTGKISMTGWRDAKLPFLNPKADYLTVASSQKVFQSFYNWPTISICIYYQATLRLKWRKSLNPNSFLLLLTS